MGFFSNDDDDDFNNSAQNEANELATQQMEMNQQELDQKKQSLYKTRLDIIKGQGSQSWVPDRNQRAPISRPGAAGGSIPTWNGRLY